VPRSGFLMRSLVPIVVLLLAGLTAAQSTPAPAPAEIQTLIQQLGSDEFADREAAEKKLNAIGVPALTNLRAAMRSQNPEVARRAQDLVRKIERRAENEKTLAPTLVELDAKDRRLDDVLADLSRQAGCDVVLGGIKQGELADRKVTLSTGGKVPLWEAMLKLCDTADIQVAGAGGFVAPDAMPYLGRAPRGVRVAANTEKAVVLEARGDAKRRPAAVFGAVLVEAVAFPKGATDIRSSALLQVWPEPRLQWQATSGLKVATATNAAGMKLVADSRIPDVMPQKTITRGGTVIVRNPDGSATLVRSGFEGTGPFRPNARQALVQFKTEGESIIVVKELGVSIFGTVRSCLEPLTKASGLEANKSSTGVGVAGVEMTVRYDKNADGRFVATVNLSYERTTIQHAGVGVELPGVKGGGPGIGNQAVHGIRITDADGKPYTLGLIGGSGRSSGNSREVMTLTLDLHPDKDGNGPPAVVTFWGSYAKPVEVPLVLKDVPLGGK
jgi:hypothetical protein